MLSKFLLGYYKVSVESIEIIILLCYIFFIFLMMLEIVDEESYFW